jgi:hypothetical protein
VALFDAEILESQYNETFQQNCTRALTFQILFLPRGQVYMPSKLGHRPDTI